MRVHWVAGVGVIAPVGRAVVMAALVARFVRCAVVRWQFGLTTTERIAYVFRSLRTITVRWLRRTAGRAAVAWPVRATDRCRQFGGATSRGRRMRRGFE